MVMMMTGCDVGGVGGEGHVGDYYDGGAGEAGDGDGDDDGDNDCDCLSALRDSGLP